MSVDVQELGEFSTQKLLVKKKKNCIEKCAIQEKNQNEDFKNREAWQKYVVCSKEFNFAPKDLGFCPLPLRGDP